MARKVVCQICKNKGDSDTFFKVTDDKGRSKYYCNKDEYDIFIKEKNIHKNLIDYILYEVFGYAEGQTVNTILFKKLKELSFYSDEVIHDCFKEQKENIQYWIKANGFNEFGTICYTMKIIDGNINDTYSKWKFKKQQELKQENNSVDLDIINQLDTNIQHKTNNDGILAFLDEGDM